MASSGTFTAQGQTSASISNGRFLFSLDFVGGGGGTVVLEADLLNDGTWETVETYTQTQAPVFYDALTVPTRLRCTVYAADIDFRVV